MAKGLTPAEKAALAANAKAVLLAAGAPGTEADRDQFFELYKMMVTSSEALVARRQGVNTFFLTINGILLTAISLFVKGDERIRLQAAAIFVLAIAGLALCVAWRTLLTSFGHLNKGKFVVINEMECHLAAAVYAGEWEALARGEDKRVYRSFTDREADVPFFIGVLHLLAAVLSLAVWSGWWELKGH